MQWQQYGITLQKIRYTDIEMVRRWRNKPDIKRYMEFQTHITPAMQAKWFDKIDNHNNYFFIILHKKEAVGLISTFNINYKEGTANAGIFVWAKSALATQVPVWAVLAMLDFDFYVLGLKKTYIKVLSTNRRAIIYNKNLGYELLAHQEKQDFQHYVLHKTNYFNKADKLRKVSAKLQGSGALLSFQVAQHPKLQALVQLISPKVLAQVPIALQLRNSLAIT